MKKYYLYILASKRNGTLYTGITSDLARRVWQHRQKLVRGFSKKYNVSMLVHYEEFDNPMEAIKREKNIKAWKRDWKLQLIEKANPRWEDLYKDLI